MAGGGLADLTGGTKQTIGRYFSVVSMVPSLLFVIYLFLLVRSGAWSHRPHWGAAVYSLAHVSVGGAALFIVAGIVFGLSIHPIQFSLVQFLEGYWGAGVFARKASRLWVKYHRRRAGKLEDKDLNGNREAGRLLEFYPEDPELIMPTRLGNVLRKYEATAGRQYRLEVLTILPHVALAAHPDDVSYLDDQRTQLDLAVRMCFTSVLATLVSAALLWHDGPWLSILAAPMGIAYLSYRGAIISAQDYGVAMNVIIDLNRFSLYERFNLPMPSNIDDERQMNSLVMKLLKKNSDKIYIEYEAPETPQSPSPYR